CRAQIVPMDPPVRSGLRPGVNQVVERGASLLELKGYLPVGAIGDDRSRPAVVDDEFQFRDRKPVIEIVEHHPGCGNADPTLQVPKTVLTDGCDDRCGAQPEVAQTSGEATNSSTPLRVSEACFAVDNRL